jgi:predicted TIM-barrel fold metal-dependent hydrolase
LDTNFKIIDAHSHIFPPKIASKATGSIGKFYAIEMNHNGSSEELLKSGAVIGVSTYLVCSSATTPLQVESINDYIASECRIHPEFFGFGTLHPGYEDIPKEIERMQGLGLHGVKLHPDFQKFNIDDDDAIKMYKHLAEKQMPVLFHTGDKRYHYSSPFRLVNALNKVPDLIAIAAHFGGYSEWDTVNMYTPSPTLFFDTSSSLFELPREECLKLIDYFGYKQFFFGVDFPMWDHQEELDRFRNLKLEHDIEKAILSENFIRLFGLES